MDSDFILLLAVLHLHIASPSSTKADPKKAKTPKAGASTIENKALRRQVTHNS
jgi:hypothetical protein